jgi:hypothetical protein
MGLIAVALRWQAPRRHSRLPSPASPWTAAVHNRFWVDPTQSGSPPRSTAFSMYFTLPTRTDIYRCNRQYLNHPKVANENSTIRGYLAYELPWINFDSKSGHCTIWIDIVESKPRPVDGFSVSCCRFDGHRVWMFHEAGGRSCSVRTTKERLDFTLRTTRSAPLRTIRFPYHSGAPYEFRTDFVWLK